MSKNNFFSLFKGVLRHLLPTHRRVGVAVIGWAGLNFRPPTGGGRNFLDSGRRGARKILEADRARSPAPQDVNYGTIKI